MALRQGLSRNVLGTYKNMHRTWSSAVIRTILQAAAEIASIALFGIMIALWAFILGPMA
jgi:hypothetical protein